MTTENDLMVSVKGLKKHFPVRGEFMQEFLPWKRTHRVVKAVDGISFDIKKGETYALVGESGCGKTTTSRVMLRLERPTQGEVLWHGADIWNLKGPGLRDYRSNVQAVFQDPWSSMNPRMRARTIIAEPLVMRGGTTDNEAKRKVDELLERVGLSSGFADRFPHEFSGGQRQRLAIARALILDPLLVVLDEPVSALDVSIRAQIMNLLKDLQSDLGLSYLIIAHHLATVRYLADRVGVMYLGKIVEEATSDELFDHPTHPYTKVLLNAALPARPQDRSLRGTVVIGEVPSPLDVPSGCTFHPRCPLATDVCKNEYPGVENVLSAHVVSCHNWNKK